MRMELLQKKNIPKKTKLPYGHLEGFRVSLGRSLGDLHGHDNFLS